jgi:hypothetical protein
VARRGGEGGGAGGRVSTRRGGATGRAAARGGTPADKVCAGCGRALAWRRSLAADWDAVRWCSDACRRRGVRAVDRDLEAAILRLLDARAGGATICPSEAARAVAPDGWEPLMEPARRAARRLVAAGALEILQGGRVVDPSTARGPIRLRRTRG